MKVINLYDEDGIEIMLDQYGDVTDVIQRAEVKVIGHATYCCSLDEAQQKIRKAFRVLRGQVSQLDYTA